MMILDSHCHPPAQKFSGNGVYLFLNSISEQDWPEIKTAAGNGFILPFYGIHPWKIWEKKDIPPLLEKLDIWLKENPEGGVGEIGLDKAARNVPYDRQIKLFKGQLELALTHNRILSFHCVRAWGKFLSLIPEKFSRPVMIHGYNGPPEIVRQFLDRGFFFSFSMNILASYNKKGLDAYLQIPEDRLFLETEFPQKGESHLLDRDMYLIHLNEWYSRAADLRRMDRGLFMEQILKNFRVFFPHE